MGFEITGVTRNEQALDRLVGFGIDLPRPGTRGDGYLLEVAGWAIGRDHPPQAVHINQDGIFLVRAPMHAPRPDVAAAFPDQRVPDTCGFRSLVAAPGLPPDFNLRLFVALGDGQFTNIAEITGRYDPLPPEQATVNPVLVTSLGRAGSSWLMHLLAHHPEIAVYPGWGYEVSAARFWIRQFRDLVEHPHGIGQPSTYVPWEPSASWWSDQNPFDEPGCADWFAGPNVEVVAGYVRSSLQDFYTSLANRTGASVPRYFAEKARPDSSAWLLRDLFMGAREIILVRDFRDMVASILAFNRQRGFAAFDRDRAASDVEFPAVLRAAVNALLLAGRRRPDALVVRYEDLVAEPQLTMTRVLGHLDLDASDAMVSDLLNRSSEQTPDMDAHRTSASASDSVGRWRETLDPHVAAACEDAFGEALAAFGYVGPAA